MQEKKNFFYSYKIDQLSLPSAGFESPPPTPTSTPTPTPTLLRRVGSSPPRPYIFFNIA